MCLELWAGGGRLDPPAEPGEPDEGVERANGEEDDDRVLPLLTGWLSGPAWPASGDDEQAGYDAVGGYVELAFALRAVFVAFNPQLRPIMFLDEPTSVLTPAESDEVLGAFLRGQLSVMVALGTLVSATWILAVNSWMQTPAGYELIDGKFYAADWWAIIFNPSFPYRLAHVMTASVITSAFLIMGVSAWRMFNSLDGPATARVLKTGVVIAMIHVMLPFAVLPMLTNMRATPGKTLLKTRVAEDEVLCRYIDPVSDALGKQRVTDGSASLRA